MEPKLSIPFKKTNKQTNRGMDKSQLHGSNPRRQLVLFMIIGSNYIYEFCEVCFCIHFVFENAKANKSNTKIKSNQIENFFFSSENYSLRTTIQLILNKINALWETEYHSVITKFMPKVHICDLNWLDFRTSNLNSMRMTQIQRVWDVSGKIYIEIYGEFGIHALCARSHY